MKGNKLHDRCCEFIGEEKELMPDFHEHINNYMRAFSKALAESVNKEMADKSDSEIED